MKKLLKVILITSLIFSLCGCSLSTKVVPKKENKIIPSAPEDMIFEDPYKDENTTPIATYQSNNGWTKISEYTYYSWTRFNPILTFSVFYSNDNYINNGNTASIYESYLNKYGNDKKFGFNIYFTLDNGEVYNNNTTKVVDWLESNSFLLIYFYDRIKHRNDSWFSHTTEGEWNDNSKVTSIKICPGDLYERISSPIYITVFTYDSEDDFDEAGNYRGNGKHTLALKKA